MSFLRKLSYLKGAAVSAVLGLTMVTFVGETQAQDAPQYGGHLRIGYSLEPTSLDPTLARSGGDETYYRPMFDNLVVLDRKGNPDPSISLAKSWDISSEPHAITFSLRQGVLFHDGTPFNAQAVKANIDRVLDPKTKATSRAVIKTIKSVDVIDDYTVRFNLDQPWAPGLRHLFSRGGTMGSPTALKKLGEDFTWNPTGTGAFKLVEAVPGSHFRYVRNENYWRKDKEGNQLPYLDEITIKVIKDDAVMAAALRAGEIDLALAPATEVKAFQNDDRFNLEQFKGSVVQTLLVFNTRLKPMGNVHLRRAMIHAVNPADINKAVYFDTAVVAKSGMWPDSTWVYQPSDTRPNYSLEKAKEELAAGGMPDGFEVDIVTWNGWGLPQASEIVRAQLGRVGIKANIEVLTVGPATEGFFQGDSHAVYLTGWSMFPEPDREATNMLKADGFYNASKQSRPDVDALIKEGATIYDRDKRKAIYGKINDIALGEAWAVPLLYGSAFATAPVKVQNLDTVFDADAKLNLKELWIKQD